LRTYGVGVFCSKWKVNLMFLNFKKLLFGMLTISVALAAPSLVYAAIDHTKPQTVYITKTGQKFHRGTCKHLKYSKIPVDIEEAIRLGYDACKVCAPQLPKE
jgi:hypothetical protein